MSTLTIRTEEQTNNDETYKAAVATGDMQTAQRMVDEAAKAAGYTIKAYHGTSNDFWTFERGNKRTRGRLNFGDGMSLFNLR